MGLFTHDSIDESCAAIAASFEPDPATQAGAVATRKVKECDAKLEKYRQALEAGTDAAIVGGWIEEIKLERRSAEFQLRRSHASLIASLLLNAGRRFR